MKEIIQSATRSGGYTGYGVTVVNNEIFVNGVKVPRCPGKNRNSLSNISVINNKIYVNGYELVNGKWKRTLAALWRRWF